MWQDHRRISLVGGHHDLAAVFIVDSGKLNATVKFLALLVFDLAPNANILLGPAERRKGLGGRLIPVYLIDYRALKSS